MSFRFSIWMLMIIIDSFFIRSRVSGMIFQTFELILRETSSIWLGSICLSEEFLMTSIVSSLLPLLKSSTDEAPEKGFLTATS
jgi:hypothetical protein